MLNKYGRFSMFVGGFCLCGAMYAIRDGSAIFTALQLIFAFLNLLVGYVKSEDE